MVPIVGAQPTMKYPSNLHLVHTTNGPAQRNVRMGFPGTPLRSLSQMGKTLARYIYIYLQKWQHAFFFGE